MFPTPSGYFLSTLRLLLITTMVATGCSGSGNSGAPATAQATGTPGAEQAVGERLFMETRFAQAFKAFLDAGGDVNDPNAGDPVVDSVETLGAPITAEAPFKGMSMNCRSCHFVDDLLTAPGGGMRTYTDFAQRSPIPARADGKTHAPRNSSTVGQRNARPPRRHAACTSTQNSTPLKISSQEPLPDAISAGSLASGHKPSRTSHKSSVAMTARLIPPISSAGSHTVFCLLEEIQGSPMNFVYHRNSARLSDQPRIKKSSMPW